MQQTIFLCEDDPVIAGAIKQYLAHWNYAVMLAKDFTQVDREIAAAAPALVVMDLRLPYYNGFHWLQNLRATSQVPVVILTSVDDDMNLVMAMNMGADDYLTKPIELPVLLAKLQGLLRRAYDYQVSATVLTAGDWRLDIGANSVAGPTGKVVLSPNETQILQLLFENAATVVTREAIVQRLWQSDAFIDQNTLAVTMTRLRQHVAPIGLNAAIQTVRGVGFRLEVTDA